MFLTSLFTRLKFLIRLFLFSRKKEILKVDRLLAEVKGDQVRILLLEGIKDWLTGNVEAEEKKRFDQIEDLRSQLKASDASLVLQDYGAGSAFSSAATTQKKTTVGRLATTSSIPAKWGSLLYHLIKRLKPADCIELGSCLGISGAYIASGLKYNQAGNLLTIEADEEVAKIAQHNFKRLGLGQVQVLTGTFEKMIAPALYLSRGTSFAFLDGHHDYAATLNYFQRLLPHLKRPAVMVFDDIFWSAGMQQAWKEIVRNEGVGFSYEAGPLGLVLIK